MSYPWISTLSIKKKRREKFYPWMVQQIRARMSKIKIEKRENNKGKHFFLGGEIQFIGTCTNHHVGKIWMSLKKQNKKLKL